MNTAKSEPSRLARLRARHYSYSTLLAALFALMFVTPALRGLGYLEYVDVVMVTLCLAAAVYATSGHTTSVWLLIPLGVTSAALHWYSFVIESGLTVRMLANGASAAFFSAIVVVLLQDILLRHRRVNLNLINGSLSVYLLLGVVFASLFALVEILVPGSFSIHYSTPAEAHGELVYLSFVTLTTLGYGDVAPLNQMSRALCTLEAVVGQIYLTVLVARLVGMHISQSTAD